MVCFSHAPPLMKPRISKIGGFSMADAEALFLLRAAESSLIADVSLLLLRWTKFTTTSRWECTSTWPWSGWSCWATPRWESATSFFILLLFWKFRRNNRKWRPECRMMGVRKRNPLQSEKCSSILNTESLVPKSKCLYNCCNQCFTFITD